MKPGNGGRGNPPVTAIPLASSGAQPYPPVMVTSFTLTGFLQAICREAATETGRFPGRGTAPRIS